MMLDEEDDAYGGDEYLEKACEMKSSARMVRNEN
jgi:hypothetical protein